MTRPLSADERGRRRYRRALAEAPARWTAEAQDRFIAEALAKFPGSVELDHNDEPLAPEQLELSE